MEERYENNKKDQLTHCCKLMNEFLNDQIGYDPSFREYFIPLCYKSRITAIQCLDYCPWCGQKLPPRLRNEWFEILEKEYGLDDPDSKEQEKLVPAEFHTDEWWKTRGL